MTWSIFFNQRGLALLGPLARLFLRTCCVQACSCPGPGTGIRSTEPRIMLPTYWSPEQLLGGSGLDTPPQRLGPAPTPFVLMTTSDLPFGVTWTPDGYHAVGMKPRTCRLSRSPTATASSRPRATKTVPPSGLPPRPSGIEPLGPSGTSPIGIVASTVSLVVSITETVSLFAFAV